MKNSRSSFFIDAPRFLTRKGRDPFTFLNQAKLIFSTNGMPPNYGDKSDAFYDRLIIIPKEQTLHLRKHWNP